MQHLRILMAAVLVLTGLAGCSEDRSRDDQPDAPGPGRPAHAPPPADPMPEGQGHSHSDAAQHDFLWNYELSASDPLRASPASPSGLHTLARGGDLLFGSLFGQYNSPGGLVIWDLADPAHPDQVGQLPIPGAVGGDRNLDVTEDGHYAVLGTEPYDCFGHVNPLSIPIPAYLIDTRDPSLPVVADVVTVTGSTLGSPGALVPTTQIHSVTVHRIGGEDYASIFGDLFLIVRGEDQARLQRIGTIETGHDLYIKDAPNGQVWAMAATEDDLAVYDLSVPTEPREIGTWEVPNKDQLAGQGINYYIHTADAAFLDDGRALIVVSSEDWEAHVSPYWVLDATPLLASASEEDAYHLETLSEWSNPGGHLATGATFSLHNPRIHDTHVLSLSSYHGGVWQFDLRTADIGIPPAPIAYMAKATMDGPVRNPQEDALETNLCGIGTTEPGELHAAMDIMDVETAPGGIVYAADNTGGLQTFVPLDSHPIFGRPAAA